MPKKISITRKREWLQAYEEGRSEAFIARKDHCDTRTVKKGIEEARRERDASLARADLLKEALRAHNQRLLDMTRKILPALVSLSSSQPIPWKVEPASISITIPGSTAQCETWPNPKVLGITLDVETETEWELFHEHIKRDPLWEALNRWKKSLASYIEAGIAMKQKMANLLKAETGYRTMDTPADPPFLDSDSIETLFRPMIEKLVRPGAILRLDDNIVTRPDKGKVKYAPGGTLAYAPGEEEECRTGIITALSKLGKSLEAARVRETFRTTETMAIKARRAAEDTCLLGLVPGRCRVCRRLGI